MNSGRVGKPTRLSSPTMPQEGHGPAGFDPSRETSASVTEWVNGAFGITDQPFRRVARGNEEMAELITAVASDDPPEKIGEEAADVAILLHLICGRLGLDLDEQIARKMKKNRGRQWTVDATGCGYHVPEQETKAPGDDWFCESCRAANFGIRTVCRFCKRPRSEVERDSDGSPKGGDACGSVHDSAGRETASPNPDLKALTHDQQ